MNDTLCTALLTSSDCTCTTDILDDGDERLPRYLRVTDPDCPNHGVEAARVAHPRTVCDHSAEVAILRIAADDIEYLIRVLGHQRVDPVAHLRRIADHLTALGIPDTDRCPECDDGVVIDSGALDPRSTRYTCTADCGWSW